MIYSRVGRGARMGSDTRSDTEDTRQAESGAAYVAGVGVDMKPPRPGTSLDSGTSVAKGGLGRSILSDRQWDSIAQSLNLSRRELQILQCMFDNQTEGAMALELGISCHTVHSHLERLYHKLQVTSRCAAVVRVFAEYVNRE